MKKGFSLLAVIFFLAIVLLACGFAVKIVVAQMSSVKDEALRLKTFYAAEGAIEWAKAKVAEEPLWYTDPSHSPQDDIKWLIAGALGYKMSVGGTNCKIIREQGKAIIYAIGYNGADIEGSSAVSIIKVQVSGNPPVQTLWKEL